MTNDNSSFSQLAEKRISRAWNTLLR